MDVFERPKEDSSLSPNDFSLISRYSFFNFISDLKAGFKLVWKGEMEEGKIKFLQAGTHLKEKILQRTMGYIINKYLTGKFRKSKEDYLNPNYKPIVEPKYIIPYGGSTELYVIGGYNADQTVKSVRRDIDYSWTFKVGTQLLFSDSVSLLQNNIGTIFSLGLCYFIFPTLIYLGGFCITVYLLYLLFEG